MLATVVTTMSIATERSAQLGAALRGAPALGLGMASLGRPGYINLGHGADLPEGRSVEDMRAHAHEVLDEAYALGVRYIDCARSYGLSEDFVGSWLADRGADATAGVVVGSKWGYEYVAGWEVELGAGEPHEVKKHTAEQLARQLGETRSLLPRLSLYQIHSATLASGVLSNDDVLDALARLRDDGVTVGASVSHPQLAPIEQVTRLARGGAPLFASVQATFNLLDQSAGHALAAAAEAGLLVIVKEAVANGRVLRRPELCAEAAALGVPPDALALAWVLSHPWVGMCLSGASTTAQLASNAAALELAPLAPALHRRLGDALAQECEEYWEERRALAWN